MNAISYSRFRLVVWFFYVFLIGYTGFHHEPTADEVDTWLMTRDATLWEFLTYFSYSGHPPLWYLLNLPFSRWLGLPIEAQQMLPFFLASGVAWLLLFRSPFPLWLLVPCLLSHHLLFQYGVMARGYPLLLLLMFFIAVLHPSRFELPYRYAAVIALLLLTEMFAWPVAGMVTLFFMQDIRSRWAVLSSIERRRYVIASVIPVVSAALAVLSVWPRPDAGFESVILQPIKLALIFLQSLIPSVFVLSMHVPDAIKDIFSAMLQSQFLGYLTFGFWFVALIFFDRRRSAWLMLAWFSGMVVIFMMVFGGSLHNWQLMPLFLLFTLWFDCVDRLQDKQSFRYLYLALAVTFGLSVPIGMIGVWHDVRYPFSGAPETARFLKEHALKHDAVIIGIGCALSKSVAAHMPKGSVWLDVEQRFTNFHLWDSQFYECARTDYDTMINRSLAYFEKDTRDIWIFIDKEIKNPRQYGLAQHFISSDIRALAWQEQYWVYKRVK